MNRIPVLTHQDILVTKKDSDGKVNTGRVATIDHTQLTFLD